MEGVSGEELGITDKGQNAKHANTFEQRHQPVDNFYLKLVAKLLGNDADYQDKRISSRSTDDKYLMKKKSVEFNAA